MTIDLEFLDTTGENLLRTERFETGVPIPGEGEHVFVPQHELIVTKRIFFYRAGETIKVSFYCKPVPSEEERRANVKAIIDLNR